MKMAEWRPPESEEYVPHVHRSAAFFATEKGVWISRMLLVVLLAALFGSQWASTSSGAVTCQLDSDMLGIAGPACTEGTAGSNAFVSYADISSLSMCRSFTLGQPVQAADWDSGWCGIYQNESWGQYRLFAYSQPGEYILLGTANGYILFNAPTQKATEELFQQLQAQLSG